MNVSISTRMSCLLVFLSGVKRSGDMGMIMSVEGHEKHRQVYLTFELLGREVETQV